MLVRRAARWVGVVWEEKMASEPMTTSSIRAHLFVVSLGLGLGLAQAISSEIWVEAESRPESRAMPTISLRLCVRRAGSMCWRMEQSME